ncbi:MAG TPA: helix-turn-helix domain-containing protein [Chloroflexota bacterium]|nr:helix-turn-helix domain-containing protein [Chloroflexota bacterium]
MTTARGRPTGPNWLTLDQTRQRLAVHPATLRRWADQNAIPSYRTPGGHRRFRLADVERFESERQRPVTIPPPTSEWGQHALASTRASISRQAGVSAYEEAERHTERTLGQRLIGMILQFAARTDEGEDLLAEARAIGEQYAWIGIGHGQTLVELLRILGAMRATMVDVTLQRAPDSLPESVSGSVRLLQRVERLLDEVQIGMVDPYVSGDPAKYSNRPVEWE